MFLGKKTSSKYVENPHVFGEKNKYECPPVDVFYYRQFCVEGDKNTKNF